MLCLLGTPVWTWTTKRWMSSVWISLSWRLPNAGFRYLLMWGLRSMSAPITDRTHDVEAKSCGQSFSLVCRANSGAATSFKDCHW